MTDTIPTQAKQLFSTVTDDGRLELALRTVPVTAPGDDEVLIRVDAAPINPSDLGVMLTVADSDAFEAGDNAASAVIPEAMRRHVAARQGISIPIGNEGAGLVVAAGASPAAQALLGKTVALAGGGMYATYRTAKAVACMIVPEGTSAEEGASSFVNPLTALSMIGTMRLDGYKALIHTAAASNLGQMLVKLCLAEGVELVNIVRSAEQVALLQSLGAKYVVDSSQPDFMKALTEAIAETQAFLAFDAIGGGRLAGQILTAMEAAALKTQKANGPYGSTQYKQVYLYGGLNTAPTELNRGFGMSWGIGGYLLTYFLQRVGQEETTKLRDRVARELKTTFASAYTSRITLQQAIEPATIAAYNRRATGAKYLITPQG
ncbi:zinc-binding dehydrogenase [Sphingomonas qilianensis]|uniref:Zinc-binding dehydrogenase n=1 Tax=Sphingomonas qilianensis TaxID=1736690 RepID=A0ABU9XNH5_9SPHN